MKFCKLFLFCKLHHEKINIFLMEDWNSVFFLIFTMKLSSAPLSYLNAHSTLNFARKFLHFLNINANQKSKEQDLNFIRSSHLCWEHMDALEAFICQTCNFMGILEDFGHIFLTRSKHFIKILKVGKIFWYETSFYQYF